MPPSWHNLARQEGNDVWRPLYNVAPTQAVIVVGDDGKRYLKPMRWGLIPSWATDHVSTQPIPMPK
jgi:putative SOS response-associated peptidase YedK